MPYAIIVPLPGELLSSLALYLPDFDMALLCGCHLCMFANCVRSLPTASA
jgi:hypothetical protein